MASGLRERKREQTYRAIRDAALGLFIEHGYAETSVAQIAAAAVVSERTFYRYYDSKEDLLLADARGYFADVEAFLEGRPGDESPMQSLLAVRGALEDRWTTGPELEWLDRLITENPPVRGHFLCLAYDHHDRIVGIFSERLGSGPDDPRPRLCAAAGIAAFLNSIILHVASDKTRSNWDFGEAMLLGYCEGLEPGAEPPSTAPS